MKTIFHDNESDTKLVMEGTFANSKAQLLDNEENVLVELEGSYPEILQTFKQLSEEDTQETEEPKQYEEDIQEGELFVVNNDKTRYYLDFDKGEIVKLLFRKDIGLPLMCVNSKGVEQALTFEDVTALENQEGNNRKFDFCYENDILLTEDTSLKGTKVSLTEYSSWIEDDGSLIIDTDCEDGIPYIKSNKSGYGAFISLENLETRKKDTPSFEIGEVVEVKEGRASLGAVGYAILVDIKENEIILQGFDKDGNFSRTWHNSIGSIKKVDN